MYKRFLEIMMIAVTVSGVAAVLTGCGGEELTREEATARTGMGREFILERTVQRTGDGAEYEIGEVGGTWVTSVNNDPSTFNHLTARDADSRAVIDPLFEYLADYDPYIREFIPNLASFEVEVDEAADRVSVIYTLRDDLYWTLPGQGIDESRRITSDDVVFWYNEINGNRELQLPSYPGQFIEMPDGTVSRIEIERIDDRRFVFHYPRIVSEPILSTNMDFGPRYLYEPALREHGVEGVLNLMNVATDVSSIPSVGPYHLVEYTPGVRVVMQRNPHYFKTDDAGRTLPYIERVIYRIVPDKNSEFLMFRDGTRDSYSLRPEDLDDLLTRTNRDYTVYRGGSSLGASFFTFNQNPSRMDPVIHGWFIQKEFRQAMSSALNRERIANQVFRGLARPAHHFFAEANPMFDPEIRLTHTYDLDRALDLLAGIGFERDRQGIMRDPEGRTVEFTINVGAENNIGIDMATIFADELSDIGINARVRPIDFQRITEMLINTYDWQVIHVSLGANYWPSGGSNVWQSSGNFHLWHPLQESPATEWEARIDYLYNEGRFTADPDEAKRIYDEYQRIILEHLPLIYTVHPESFLAVRNKWGNVFFDTLGGMKTEYLYLKNE